MVAGVSAALMIGLGLPFLGINFTGVNAGVLPPSASARQVDDALAREFPPNFASPIIVAIDAPRSARPEIEEYAAELRRLPGTAAVSEPAAVTDSFWRVDVIPRGRDLDDETLALVGDVRDADTELAALVGGQTANFVDERASIGAHLPYGLAILVGTTLLILFLMTGSVLLPIKTLVMNALTLSAAFGILVLIFQDGRFEGLLDYRSLGGVDLTQPLLIGAVAFALSTDYAVFLLGRIKEAYDRGLTNTEAVAFGLERTGRIVTAAAVLFSVAIGAFSTSEISFIKQIGVGVLVAVVLDATVVRGLLVPALMKLLGDLNWWAPAPLRRLHARIGVSESETPVARPSTGGGNTR
jgi:RND superfamily putative drug exporter